MIVYRWRQSCEALRQRSPGVLGFDVLRLLLRPLCGVQLLMIFEKDLRGPLVPVAMPPGLAIAPATAADIDAILNMVSGPGTALAVAPEAVRTAARQALAAECRTRLAAGDRCFVARQDGALIHVNWTIVGRIPDILDAPVPLAAHEVYTTGAFTAPRARGRRIHDAVLAAMLRCAAAAGDRTAYTATALGAAGSRKCIRRLEWRVREWIVVLWRGQWERLVVLSIRGGRPSLFRRTPAGPAA